MKLVQYSFAKAVTSAPASLELVEAADSCGEAVAGAAVSFEVPAQAATRQSRPRGNERSCVINETRWTYVDTEAAGVLSIYEGEWREVSDGVRGKRGDIFRVAAKAVP
jgi:hypothetical protein